MKDPVTKNKVCGLEKRSLMMTSIFQFQEHTRVCEHRYTSTCLHTCGNKYIHPLIQLHSDAREINYADVSSEMLEFLTK